MLRLLILPFAGLAALFALAVAGQLGLQLLAGASLDQIWFAVSVGFTVACFWAFSLTGVVMLIAIVAVGLGFLSRSPKFAALGVGIFVLCVWLSSLLGPFHFGDYGRDPAAEVVALGEDLKRQSTTSEQFAVRFGGRESVVLSTPFSTDGHRYVTLNRLGRSSLTPEQLATRIAADLNAHFPILAATKRGQGKDIKAGNVFDLGNQFPVKSSDLKGHYFSLEAGSKHLLKGTAHHGVVRDGSGDLWLFQFGEGVQNEGSLEQAQTYPLGGKMWARMAEKIRTIYATEIKP